MVPRGACAAHGALSAATRERLLDVAEELFAERGFAATSVRDITAEAGCNLAAVNYHFGGKHNLYVEVFRRRHARLREQRVASVRSTLNGKGPQSTLERLLASFASSVVEPLMEQGEGRRLVQLMLREMAEPQLPPGLFHSELIEPVHAALAEGIAEVEPTLEATGVRLGIDSFIAQLLHVVRLWSYQARSEGERPPSASLGEQIQFIVWFTAAGMRACATGSQHIGRKRNG